LNSLTDTSLLMSDYYYTLREWSPENPMKAAPGLVFLELGVQGEDIIVHYRFEGDSRYQQSDAWTRLENILRNLKPLWNVCLSRHIDEIAAIHVVDRNRIWALTSKYNKSEGYDHETKEDGSLIFVVR
jgi:hypothetical protein